MRQKKTENTASFCSLCDLPFKIIHEKRQRLRRLYLFALKSSAQGESCAPRKKTLPYMAALALMLTVSLAGCGHSAPADAAPTYRSEIEELAVDHQRRDPLVKSQMRGRETYEHYCAICHGADADGNGFNAAMLDPSPRNFGDPAFWKRIDDDRLFRTIHDGGKTVGKSNLMPAWGRTLTERQIHDLAAYLRTVPAATEPDSNDSAGE